MSNFIPDEFSKTVVFPVLVTEGKITPVHGARLPMFKAGAEAQLVMPAHEIVDQRVAERMHQEIDVEILATGAAVLLSVRRRDTPPSLQSQFDEYIESATQDRIGFVRVVLKAPQILRLRGTKKGELRLTPCHIPALKRDAVSLNQAYTFVSEAFEPERQSHTGNVFQGGRYHDGKVWQSLSDLRDRYEQEDIAQRLASDADDAEGASAAPEERAAAPNENRVKVSASAWDVSHDILPRLRAHYPRWIRPGLSEVCIVQRGDAVWLESAMRDNTGWRESVARINLASLADISAPLFPPQSTAQENAERFLREMSTYLIVHYTDLFSPEGAWEAAQAHQRTCEQQALLF